MKNNVIKLISILMALGMLFAVIPCGVAAYAEETKTVFTDVAADDWFYGDVEYVNEKGLMKGVAEKTFAPDAPLSRAMCATILYRMAGEPDVSDVPTIFPDLWPKYWYFKAVKWARSENIVFGKDDGKFHPDDTATRAEMAVMIYRYCDSMDLTLKHEHLYTGFSDEKNIPNYAKGAVIFLYEAGVINGKSNNNFAPDDTITRAEAAALIHRLIDNIVYPEEEPVPPVEIDPDDILAKYGLKMNVYGFYNRMPSTENGYVRASIEVEFTKESLTSLDFSNISVSAELSYVGNIIDVILVRDDYSSGLFYVSKEHLRELQIDRAGIVLCELSITIGDESQVINVPVKLTDVY